MIIQSSYYHPLICPSSCSLISTRGEAVDVDEEGEEKKKKKKMKMKKKKKPAHGDHQHEHEEAEDDHETVEWEDLAGHDNVHGHNHGQANKDVLPVEATEEDANADEDEVEAGRFAGGGFWYFSGQHL